MSPGVKVVWECKGLTMVLPFPRVELQRQQTLALAVKKSLRQVLKKYENEFTASHGR